MFNDFSKPVSARDRRALLLSFGVHFVLLGSLIVLPLLYYDRLPDFRSVTTLFSAEPPPPPPPSPMTDAPPVRQSVPRVVPASPWVPPAAVPDTIPSPDAEPPMVDAFAYGNGPGLPAGLVFGISGGAIGPSFPEGLSSAPPPPLPPPPAAKAPIRVGGTVQAAKLIRRVEPSYPEIARRARIQGVVLLEVQVGAEGSVENVRLIRGHPLLNAAAVDAVSQWKYSPTLLNGEPVPVIATVTVRFVLN